MLGEIVKVIASINTCLLYLEKKAKALLSIFFHTLKNIYMKYLYMGLKCN